MPLVLPILIPFITAAILLLGWRHLWLQRGLGILSAFGVLGVAIQLLRTVQAEGIQVAQMGNWPAPFGISLVADHFSALMVLVSGVLASAVAVYSAVDIDRLRQSHGYYPLLHVMMMGVNGAFLAGDLFNLYVWFEVLLISSFVLMALGSDRRQLEGALKYVTLNLISSFLFLTAVGILYGVTGTLNLAHIASRLPQLENPALSTTLSMLFLLAFGIKSAVFPLFFWLPASYHTPPAAVSAIFAGLLTKVGVYALIRVFTLLFVEEVQFTHTLLLIVSGLTMITGVLAAIAQSEMRRILSAHIVSQIGYMTMGLGFMTPLGLAGAIFFLVHQVIVKSNLFLVSGVVHALRGTYRLDRLGGFYHEKPWLAACFAVPALSLAGLPPLSGFVGKLSLVKAGLEAEQYAVTATSIFVSLLTLYSMVKIWNGVFWGPKTPPESSEEEQTHGEHQAASAGEQLLLALPIVFLILPTVLIGVWAEPLFAMTQVAGEELLNRDTYIEAVLGAEP